ncbi:MAG TPA: coenzyme F420-0:L-glutamate ligase, partial [Anaerolineales bacterium]|nr:coenzyme F420-0:L-glutamate ligase [Anaerolineales bacterium]
MPLTLTSLKNIPLIRQDDDLADIILNSLQENKIQLEDIDILVIAQKIVSKSEGRMVDLETVVPSQPAT